MSLTRRHFLFSTSAALTFAVARSALAQIGRAQATQDLGALAFGALETRQSLTEAQIDGIARALLAQLSLDEKIGMMSGDTPFFQGYLVLQLWMGSRGGAAFVVRPLSSRLVRTPPLGPPADLRG